MIMPAKTVFGVIMQNDERVIYYHRADPGWQKPLLIVVGVLLLIGIIGIFILLAGLMATTTVYVVTTKRFIIIEGEKGKNVKQLRLDEIKHVTRKIGSGGQNVQWIDLADEKRQTVLQYQVANNKPEMVRLFDKWLQDPASMQDAENVWFDSVAGPKPKLPPPTST